MDIYYCDECGSRITDLDLRAGKGMRQRNDQICSQCVGSGLAAAWIARSGGSAEASAAAAANGSAALAVAVATASDPIAVARDRAVTKSDDPFVDDVVVEPAPSAKVKTPAHETDALPAKKTPAPPSDSSPLGDGFAAAAGAMGALAGSLPDRRVDAGDDLADAAEDPLAATSPTAGIDVSPDNVSAGKAETSAVPAKSEPKKSTSSRQAAAQKKNGTTTRRTAASNGTSRRTAPSPLANKKVMVLSLISCAVIAIIFFGVVIPGMNKERPKAPAIRDDQLAVFSKFVDEAKTAANDAMNNRDDLARQRKAIAAIRTMNVEYDKFYKEAIKVGWTEEGFEQELENLHIKDIKNKIQPINQRIFILEQQGQK